MYDNGKEVICERQNTDMVDPLGKVSIGVCVPVDKGCICAWKTWHDSQKEWLWKHLFQQEMWMMNLGLLKIKCIMFNGLF